MPKRRYLHLKQDQREALIKLRDQHPKAYLRERAAALLKIAQGASPHAVARNGLLRPRDPDTIYTWMDRFEAKGIKGLYLQTGRGRKPAFSPCIQRAGTSPTGRA